MSKPLPSRSLNEWQRKRDFLQENPQFSAYQLDWQLRFRDENGLGVHTAKFGRFLYLHIPGVLSWLDENRG